MRTAVLALLLVLPTQGYLFASNGGLWARAKQGKVLAKLTTMVDAAKLTRHLLLGASLALMLGVVSCLELDDAVNVLIDELGDEDTGFAIRIGLNYDGGISPSALSGAELAIAQINAEGGVLGVPLKLLSRDSMGDGNRSYQVTDELIVEQRVHAFVGPAAHALLVAEIAHQQKVPMVTTLATNPNITNAGNYVFMAAFTDDFQGQVLAQFARDELKASTAAIISQGRNAYSRVLSRSFTENFEAVGGNEVVVQQSYRAGDTDFSRQLAAVDKKAPEVIFVPGFVPEVALVVKQGKKMGIDAIFIGADGWGAAGLLENGGNALEGAYFLDHFSAGATGHLPASALQFIDDYTAANRGKRPTSRAALGYDAVHIVAQAIERANSLEGAEIRDEIAETVGYMGATQLLRYNNDRHAIKPAFIQKIKNGRIIFHQVVTPD